MHTESDLHLDETWAVQRVQMLLCEGVSGFNELLHQAEGMSPFSLKNALRALGHPVQFLNRSVPNGASSVDDDHLPIQHPLDCSWRFTRKSSIQLLDHSDPGQDWPTLLIGCPSVAVHSVGICTKRRISLVDIDGRTLDEVKRLAPQVNCIEQDVFSEKIPGGFYKSAILDPPWYPAEMQAFLIAASRAVSCGGSIIVVVPPKGVRRSAEHEIQAIVSDASKYGLTFCEHSQETVSYCTPFFEKQALRAAKLHHVHPEWRKGDLLMFRRNDLPIEFLEPQEMQPYRQWSELRLQTSRVRFDCLPTQGASSELGSILPGDILPDISRRNPHAARASVWTSGNRIFASSDPKGLQLALSCVVEGELPHMNSPLSQAAQELYKIMLIEEEEVAAQ